MFQGQRARLRARGRRLAGLFTTIGPRATVAYCGRRLDRWGRSVFALHPRQVLHPLYLRPQSSDLRVFSQIFVEVEYACLDDLAGVDLVVDCGANVGFSSAYFLSRFPSCRVVAIEPDPGNFAMLRRNLAPYGSRVELRQAGVWSHSTGLVLNEQPYRDGQEWARQVRACGPDEEAEIEGVDLGSILAEAEHGRVSILKVDIEGAEAVIFSTNYAPWLGRVDTIVIELHDDATLGRASEAFFAAIDGRGYQVSRSGELTVCTPTRPAEHGG